MMCSITYDDFLLVIPLVDPNAVRRLVLTFAFARTAKMLLPVAVFVVMVNIKTSVAIRQKKVAVIEKSEIGRHEAVASPDFSWIAGFTRCVMSTLGRQRLFSMVFFVLFNTENSCPSVSILIKLTIWIRFSRQKSSILTAGVESAALSIPPCIGCALDAEPSTFQLEYALI